MRASRDYQQEKAIVPSISRALNHTHTQEMKADSAKCLMNHFRAPKAPNITRTAPRTVSAAKAPCSLVVSNATADLPHYLTDLASMVHDLMKPYMPVIV